MDKETNKDQAVYGYIHPWDIPGNEGCGGANPLNRGKSEDEIPPFKVPFAQFKNAEGEIRYAPCTREVANAIRNMDRNEVRRKDTESRCLVHSDRYGLKKCREDCLNCPYNRVARDGKPVSLDELYEDFEFEPSDDSRESSEDGINEKVLLKEIKLWIDTLDDIDRTLADNFNETDVYIAELTRTSKQLIGYRRRRLIRYLQEKLKK